MVLFKEISTEKNIRNYFIYETEITSIIYEYLLYHGKN